ncbi:pantoate--beta-alanine ligase [Rubritalea marina]|uniref:pantoate--beta-alanine ligase n=1 Tax=Rubritalea marina TaxID=361055 RepID=UPI000369AEFF|nr:pantoate--beta-alanine ligase [Rubritalea marina]
MEIARTITELLLAKRKYHYAPVLVPTMGALHEGHQSLIRMARSIAGPNGCVAVSIFVNPIQFNRQDDLDGYPNTPEEDLAVCEQLGVDLVFIPKSSELYAENRSIKIQESSLSNLLCGATRPGHFDGVCTVIAKLFNLFTPMDAVFGKKDFQQLAIINRLVRDLNFPVVVHGAETVRETDGLAMSSRNVRLSTEARAQAPAIAAALNEAKQQFLNGQHNANELTQLIRSELQDAAPSSTIDYLECVDAATLQAQEVADAHSVIAIAVFFGDVRLIDNIELNS